MDPVEQYPSPYQYGPNNPMNGIDPNGMFWEELGNWLTGNGWIKAPETPGDYWSQKMTESLSYQNTKDANTNINIYEHQIQLPDPTPLSPSNTKEGSFNRLSDRGVYNADDTINNTFITRNLPGLEYGIHMLSDPSTQALLLTVGPGVLNLGLKVSSRAISASRGLSQFYLRNKATIDMIGKGGVDALPGFPNIIPNWKYGVGLIGGYTIYESTK